MARMVFASIDIAV